MYCDQLPLFVAGMEITMADKAVHMSTPFKLL